MDREVILYRGLPASGKTTAAKERMRASPGRYKRISKDMLRSMLDDGVYSDEHEQYVLRMRDVHILAALDAGYSVLVDDTNFGRHEQQIRALVGDRARVEIEDFTHVPLAVCIERDKQRQSYVGEDVIRRMWKRYLAPKQRRLPPPPLDRSKPLAVIFDMDGTLAILGDRSPYDTSTCDQDILNDRVADVLRLYHAAPYHPAILIVSGRKAVAREMTERWLAQHDIPYTALFMRKTEDDRQDAVVKREIFEAEINDTYSVIAAYDDRDQVVKLWRSLNIVCFQVAEGDF